MALLLKEDFRPGLIGLQLTADWLKTVAKRLNNITIVNGEVVITEDDISIYPNVYESSGDAMPLEWTVEISGTNATVYHRPIVFADKVIPSSWAADDAEYYSTDWFTLYPPSAVDLLDDLSVGKGSGFIYVEIDLFADTLTCKHSTTRPVDDLANSLVRWPLVHVVQTTVSGTPDTYTFAIDYILHHGAIKITNLWSPP
jgi:hypothetical protein